MDYSNPEIPEGINTSKDHPLKEFFLLTVGVFGGLAVIIFILSLIVDKFAHYLPYSIEKDTKLFVMGTNSKDEPVVRYLQSLADKISKAQNLPDEMKITVYYSDSDIVNAYATLGGNIVLFKGLLDKLPNENALTMVMAHEIAHIKHRHPIRSLGSGLVVGLIISVVSTGVGDSIISQSVGTTSTLTTFKFSRDHEHEADQTAIDTVKSLYGHLQGAADLFKIIGQLEGENRGPEFLNTHPATENRLERIQQQNTATGNIAVTPLPEDFHSWLKEHEQKN